MARELLTIPQVCDELQVARSTLDLWRRLGTAPRFIRLPNNSLRCDRADFELWLQSREVCA